MFVSVLFLMCRVLCFFCYKQKTAYDMRISDWSSDVCSSDLRKHFGPHAIAAAEGDLLGEALEAIRAALGAIENTLRARGYSNGECTDSWSRSEERRVGKEGVSTCRARLSP